MKIFLKILNIIILFFIIGSSIGLGKGITFQAQMTVYDGLRTTSGIIFAVMGTWMALLYPSKLAEAFGKQNNKESDDNIGEINRLFKPMIYSTVILIIVIGMTFIVPLAKQISFLHQYKGFFRAASFTLIGSLTYLQFWSLIFTLIPSDSIKDDLINRKKREELLDRMRPGNVK